MIFSLVKSQTLGFRTGLLPLNTTFRWKTVFVTTLSYSTCIIRKSKFTVNSHLLCKYEMIYHLIEILIICYVNFQACYDHQLSKPGRGKRTANSSTSFLREAIFDFTPSSSVNLALNSFKVGPQFAWISLVSWIPVEKSMMGIYLIIKVYVIKVLCNYNKVYGTYHKYEKVPVLFHSCIPLLFRRIQIWAICRQLLVKFLILHKLCHGWCWPTWGPGKLIESEH